MSGSRRTPSASVPAPILLVDDRASNLVALEAVLASPEHELVSVTSGPDALAQLVRRDFAVVLLDVQMPTMDGFETASKLRLLLGEKGRQVPVIFVTGIDTDRARVLRAYAGGAVDFIQKPLEPEIIRAKVATFVALYRAKERIVTEQAEARRRLETLGQLALSLSRARAPSEVAAVVVDEGMRAAQADTCTLYLLDEAGTTLELAGHRGVAPEIIERVRRITETEGNPATFAMLRSGTAAWAEDEDDYRKIFPALAATKAQGQRAKAFWSMPLIVEDRTVGLLGMGFYESRPFSAVERSFVETFTQQCAQAMLRALRREREDAARRLLATTLRSIGDAVIATDTERRITFLNPVAERLIGWSEEVLGRPLDDVFRIFSEETGAALENPAAEVLRTGTVVGLASHTLLRSKLGAETPIGDSAAPIRGEDGKLLGVVLVFRDATDDRARRIRGEFIAKASEALVSSLDYKATLATVAQLAVPQLADWCSVEILEPGAKASQQVAVAHQDPRKVALARQLGERYPPDPDAPRGAPQVIRSGKSELHTEIPAALLEGGARDAEHLRLIRELRLESAMVVPLLGRDRVLGAMTFVYADSGRHYGQGDLLFAEDFAHRAAMAIENAEAHKAAQNAVRARENLLAIVSHDLRNPLSTVLMCAHHFARLADGERAKKPVSTIIRAVDRMERLIGDLLDMSKIEAGNTLSVDLERHNVVDLIRQTAELLEPIATARHLTLTADLSEPLLARCDGERVQQALTNLIGNAIKFTRDGGAIVLGARRAESEILVSVSDTGAGMPSDQVPHIFKAYWQADVHEKRGIGLGLSIVKAIVDAHGGRIWVETALGSGSTFYFTLPTADGTTAGEEAPTRAKDGDDELKTLD